MGQVVRLAVEGRQRVGLPGLGARCGPGCGGRWRWGLIAARRAGACAVGCAAGCEVDGKNAAARGHQSRAATPTAARAGGHCAVLAESRRPQPVRALARRQPGLPLDGLTAFRNFCWQLLSLCRPLRRCRRVSLWWRRRRR